MENSDGGVGPFLWISVVGVLLVGALLSGACGAPIIDSGGLSWDNSGWINAQNQKTERERINANRDIRVAEEWNGTMQVVGTTTLQVAAICVGLWAASKTIPAIFASIATMFAAWAARPHRPAAPANITVNITYQQALAAARPILLAQPDARLEWVEEDDVTGWAIINERFGTLRPLELTDSQHPT
jgi:hypothetical protein